MKNTKYDIPIDDKLVENYTGRLVSRVYKILPIVEEARFQPKTYIESLLRELIGFSAFLEEVGQHEIIMSICSILQYLIDSDLEKKIVRTEVFHLIDLVNKLKKVFQKNG